MSIALEPFVNGYYETDSDHANLESLPQSHFAGSRKSIDGRVSNRIAAVGLKFIYTLSVLAVSGAVLALTGWLCFEFLASLQAQLESLTTTQLMHALAGA